MKITITGTSETIQPPNPYFHYVVCKSDKELPETYNRGYNTYAFKVPVEFIFENMPKELERAGEKFTWYYSHLHIITPSGRVRNISYHMTEKDGVKHEEGYTI